jgi:hypothetical protein
MSHSSWGSSDHQKHLRVLRRHLGLELVVLLMCYQRKVVGCAAGIGLGLWERMNREKEWIV